jgi:multidrug resistance efflux pump
MRNKFIILLAVFFSVQAKAELLVLSGEIQSTEYQMVTVPKSQRWQVFLQWMAEEGTVVQKGDLVAVFDSGGVEAQLEQNIEQLALNKLELKQTTFRENQAVQEAQSNLRIAELEVQKRKIEASVPEGQISQYEHGNNQLAYERALLNLVKAREQLKLRESQREVAIRKKKLEIIRLEENIAYQQSQIEKLSVKAEITGPVTAALHPWNGKKITAGSNLQASWEVLKIQAKQSYNVIGWVHEADAHKLPEQTTLKLSLDAYPGKQFTGNLISVSSQPELKPTWSDGAYYRVNIDFANPPDINLSPGMSVRILHEESNT